MTVWELEIAGNMPTVNFSKWAVVAFNDDTGLGRQATDLQQVLGLGLHLIKPSEKMQTKPFDKNRGVVLGADLTDDHLEDLISSLEGLIFLESPYSHVRILDIATKLKKRKVLVPNWEWFPGIRRSACRQFDLFVCPTRYTERWVRRFGYRNVTFAPPAIDYEHFEFRERSGRANHFVHNAGVINRNDRKSTDAVLRSFSRANVGTAVLHVNAQFAHPILEKYDKESNIDINIGNIDSVKDLYTSYDVSIQPSRLEGIGFQILEAFLSGLPTITLNFPPMNEYTNNTMLLADANFGLSPVKPIQPSCFHAFLKSVNERSLTQKIEYLARTDLSIFGADVQVLREHLKGSRVRSLWSSALSDL